MQRFSMASAPTGRPRVDLGPCVACDVRDVVFCSALNEAERPRLAAIVLEVRIKPQQAIFYEGDPADHVFNVTTGAVKLYKLLADGRRQITGFLFRGDFLGLALNTSYAFSAEAIAETRLCRFPRRDLESLMDQYPKLERRLFAMANTELSAAQDQMLLLGRKSAKERVASFLIKLSERAEQRGDKPDPIPLPMTRNEIADFLGLTTETVSRTFTDLRKTKVIALPEPSTVRLLDREGLDAIAAGEGSAAL
jgi:CRP/FNR family transcriptional regulator